MYEEVFALNVLEVFLIFSLIMYVKQRKDSSLILVTSSLGAPFSRWEQLMRDRNEKERSGTCI